MVEWNPILDELKSMKKDQKEIGNPVAVPEPPKEIPDTEKKWYQIPDVLSRSDELLEAILRRLEEIPTISPAPTPTAPEPSAPLPPGMIPRLDALVTEQTRTKQLLEGYNFVTNQGIVSVPGTPQELVSTVRTYLIIIRANTTNTADIYVGSRGVSATTGFILSAGESLAIQIDNLKKSVWIDAATANDSVSWIALVD